MVTAARKRRCRVMRPRARSLGSIRSSSSTAAIMGSRTPLGEEPALARFTHGPTEQRRCSVWRLADLTISLPFNTASCYQESVFRTQNEIAAVIVEPIPSQRGSHFPK